MIMVSEI